MGDLVILAALFTLLLDLFRSGVFVLTLLIAVLLLVEIDDRFSLGVVATVELTLLGVF